MMFRGIKRKLIITLIILFSIACLTALIVISILGTKDNSNKVNQELEEPRITVLYMADNSYIIGHSLQLVKSGEDAEVVTVVPNIGYRFVKWADTGSTNPTRRDFNVQQEITAIAIIEGPLTCHVIFQAGEGGTVEGATEQTVTYGAKGETVVAVPNEGYKFVKWSDGETDAVRENTSVTWYGGQPYISAEFIRYKRSYKLNYNGATEDKAIENVDITSDNITSLILPVPKRDDCIFEGWYSDWHQTTQVTDSTGKIIVGSRWFFNDYLYNEQVNPEGNLYAKWKATNDIPTYKILMVYVTEIKAELESTDGELIKVEYSMTDVERRICERISQLMEEYLNAIFNASVNFDVDSYFTKQVITTENFTLGTSSLPGSDKIYRDYILGSRAFIDKEIPELGNLVDEYRSVITTFSMNDFDHLLHITGGSAGAKFGRVHFESVIEEDESENEVLFDETYLGVYRSWESIMEGYIHEFTHTVEMQLKDDEWYGLHNLAVYYSHNIKIIDTAFEYMAPYLTNTFEINGELIGIPYNFWEGN